MPRLRGARQVLLRWARPDNDATYFPNHFGGRFSENAFGPSM